MSPKTNKLLCSNICPGGKIYAFGVSRGRTLTYNFIEPYDGVVFVNIIRKAALVMKIVLIRSSGILSPILRKLFGIKKNQ